MKKANSPPDICRTTCMQHFCMHQLLTGARLKLRRPFWRFARHFGINWMLDLN
jgi:hypothetical protein